MKNEKMKEILDFFRNNKKKTCIGAGAGVAVIAVCVAVGITLGNGAKTTASNTGTQTQTETTIETAETGDNAADAAGRKYRAGSNAADYRIL